MRTAWFYKGKKTGIGLDSKCCLAVCLVVFCWFCIGLSSSVGMEDPVEQCAETAEPSMKQFTWEEVSKHTGDTDRCLVIDSKVYDITRWGLKHPGGPEIIKHYAGQDATEPFKAFHKDLNYVGKYLQPLCIGELTKESRKETDPKHMKKDFEILRETAKKMNLFTPSVCFYLLHLGHVVALEILGFLIMYNFGTSWLPYLLTVVCLIVAQAQAGYNQHDFGHLQVFKTIRANRMIHRFLMNFLMGLSSDWWNDTHYRHHSKPNDMERDPDIQLEDFFVVGEKMAKKVAEERPNIIPVPYNWQHWYFFAIGPPFLIPVYYPIVMFVHCVRGGKWIDFSLYCLYYLRIIGIYSSFLGFFGAVKFLLLIRLIHSNWFVSVSMCSHMANQVGTDRGYPWLKLQLVTTCNIESSPFNDWFLGHVNFQIEHHLFPTMPRHNLYKIRPLVKSLCKKYDILYEEKSWFTAIRDVISNLKSSSEIWSHYYHTCQLN